MKLGIMQPYFFPYIGYFQLINATDKWVIFDDIQYIRHGWVNRNRILHPDLTKEWIYIIIPLQKHSQDNHICDIKILNNQIWKNKIMGQINHYRKNAPFYNETKTIVKQCLNFNGNNLSELNTYCLKEVCKYLDIDLHYQIFSNMDINLGDVDNPDDWALEISKKFDSDDWALEISKRLNADEYINPIGGKEIFDKEKFAEAGIKLSFLEPGNIEYEQKRKEFIPNLSIIDVMMFNSKEKIHELLKEYNLV
jgi:hypothetical protein